MLLKYTLRNIFAKKGRLFILMFCIIASCFTANIAFEFSAAMNGSFKNMMGGKFGNADYYLISVSDVDSISQDTFDDFPCEVKCAIPNQLTKREIRRKEESYAYALTDSVSIYAFENPDEAKEINLIKDVEIPETGYITIGQRYQDKYGYEIGDIITVTDYNDEEVELTVSGIFKEAVFLGGDDDKLYAVISEEQYELIKGESATGRRAFVQITDREMLEDFEKYIEENHRGMTIMPLGLVDSVKAMLDNAITVLYLIFALVFILVIFVTISFTEKIITERMSVIGTLRSVGMSIYKTTAILLFENVLYGLIGGIIAMVLYLFVRNIATKHLENFDQILGAPRYYLLILVIIGAVLIEVLIPIKDVFLAAKTSIRDIIFETRDSAYKVSYPKTIIGAILIVVGIVLGLVTKNMPLAIVALVCVIFGGGLTIQFLIRAITSKLAVWFGKKNMPVAELAAMETGSKKPNSGNAVLAVTTICAATAISVAGFTFIQSVENKEYNADLVIQEIDRKAEKYEYISELDGVEEVEAVYWLNDSVSYEGKDYYADVWAVPQTDLYAYFEGVDKDIAKDECILDVTSAYRGNAKVGDTLTITFHNEGIFPREVTLTVKQIITVNSFGRAGRIIINPELYKEMYPKTPAQILIKSSDLAVTEEALRDSLTNGEIVTTPNHVDDEDKIDKIATIGGMGAAIAASIVLTLIGISGNQVIGFVGRKKEYAMLHSCACDRATIIRMIWIENAFLFGISVIMAGFLSVPVILILGRIFLMAEFGVTSGTHFPVIAVSLIILWLITMMTALTPIKSLKKMNTAAELKYE